MAKVKVAGVTVPKKATAASRPDLFGTRGQLTPDGDGGVDSRMLIDKPEYATPEVSKVSDGFYVTDRGLPWHVTLSRMLNTPELMKGADRLLTGDEAFVAAGAFDVDVLNMTVAGTDVLVPNKFATVRRDTGAALGVVGRTWKPFQERDLIAFCDELVKTNEAKYETAVHLYGGSQFLISMELDHLDLQVPGDPSELKTYLLARTSHDGSTKTGFYITTVRVVCKNTADLATKGALSEYTIRHNVVDPTARVAQAQEALQIAFAGADRVKALTTHLAMAKLVDSQVYDILKAVWPVSTSDGEAATDKQSRHVDRAFELYESSPNLEGIRGTGWGAYNAVTEYVDHGLTYKGRAYDAGDVRADTILFLGGHDTKERALKLVLAAAK